MRRQEFSDERERIISDAMEPFIEELMLVDAQQLAALLTLELFSHVSDIVNSAADHHFEPGFLSLGHGGQAKVDWISFPVVTLDLVIRAQGLTAYFSLTMQSCTPTVRLQYIQFDEGEADAGRDTHFLKQALAANVIRRTAPGRQRR